MSWRAVVWSSPGAVQVFVEDGEGLLGGLAGGAELVETAAAVEFLDGAGFGVVGGVVEVAPGAELVEGAEEAVGVERSGCGGSAGFFEGGENLGGASEMTKRARSAPKTPSTAR